MLKFKFKASQSLSRDYSSMFWVFVCGFLLPIALCHGAGFCCSNTPNHLMWLLFNPDRLSRAVISPGEDLENASGRAGTPDLNVLKTEPHTCGYFSVKGLAYISVITYAYTQCSKVLLHAWGIYVPPNLKARREENKRNCGTHTACRGTWLTNLTHAAFLRVFRRCWWSHDLVNDIKWALLLFQRECVQAQDWLTTKPRSVSITKIQLWMRHNMLKTCWTQLKLWYLSDDHDVQPNTHLQHL